MTPDIYERKRNELISLLEKILAEADGLDAKTRNELEETKGKLKRNSFEIALVGEFQGGKSTTFDTICDCREISPRGTGIKTSACKISAQSVPAEEEERAVLRWKNDEELLLTMLDIIKQNLVNDKKALGVFTQKDADGNPVFPPLADPNVRKLAQKAVDAEWTRYQANRAGYDRDQSGLLDLLEISTLILKFYTAPELEKLRAKAQISIDELKKMVAFPKDWDKRWEKGGRDTDWTFADIPFVFLGDVQCYIHCGNLERLGCVITDCPGLFAGPWDTAVAQRAMLQSDAILYLIGGSRQITAADLRALSEIRKTQQEHKLFFAINARTSRTSLIDENIRDTDFARIRQQGFDLASPEDIDIFNALIAFSSKAPVPEGTNPNTGKPLARDWNRLIKESIKTYLDLDDEDPDDVQKTLQLCSDPDKRYSASDMPGLLQKIETSIISKKFESILVNRGTDKAKRALNVLEGNLKQKEDAAEKDSESVEQDVKAARQRLEEFQTFVRKTITEELDNAVAAEQTANDFFRCVYENNVDELSKDISYTVVSEFNHNDIFLNLAWRIVKSRVTGGKVDNANDIAMAELEEPIREDILSVLNPAAQGWKTNLENGQNEMFNLVYGQALDRVCMRVREEWDSTYNSDNNFLAGLAPDADWDMPSIPIDGPQPVVGTINVEGEALTMLGNKILAVVLGALVGFVVALIIEVLIVMFVTPGGVWLAPVALFTATGFARYFSDHVSSRFQDRLRPQIAEKLRELFSYQKHAFTEAFKSTLLKGIVDEIKERCKNSLRGQLDAFNARVEETLALKKKSLEEQVRIGILAKKVRTEQIEPARKQIAEFNDGLKAYFD